MPRFATTAGRSAPSRAPTGRGWRCSSRSPRRSPRPRHRLDGHPAGLDGGAANQHRSPAGSSTADQLTFASFLQSGAYDRHLRARKRYRPRRDRLVQALAERLPRARLLGVAAGLHHPESGSTTPSTAPPWSPGPRPAACRSPTWPPTAAAPTPIGPGLVLGYGSLAGGQVDEAVALLAAAVADSRRML